MAVFFFWGHAAEFLFLKTGCKAIEKMALVCSSMVLTFRESWAFLGEASRDWGEAARKKGNWEPWNPDTGLKTCARKQLIYLISLCFGFTPFKTGLLGLPWRSVCDIKPVARLIKSSGNFVLWLSHGVPAKTVVVVWQRESCLIRSVRWTEMALLLPFNRIGKWDPEH